MNRFCEIILKIAKKKIYPIFFSQKQLPTIDIPFDNEGVNAQIHDAILKGQPFMVARFGSVEMNAIANYIGVRDNPHSIIKYIKGEINEWWWSTNAISLLQSNAGFFPLKDEMIIKFGEIMSEDSRAIDILGSWIPTEYYLRNQLVNAKKVRLEDLKPKFFWDGNGANWTQALKGKRVLVVHPFTDTIKNQYAKRKLLFKHPDFLPEFDLLTVKAVQSIGGVCEYATWFDALDHMKQEMDKIDYDVCILGCGAYGLPLAAHAKRTGHVAVHLGGVTQLMFGIRGNRWENREEWNGLFNENWVRPSDSERPLTAQNVEGACYW